MHANAIRTLLARRPFIPFEMHLADGRTIPVRHPDMLVFAPGGASASTFVEFETLIVIPMDRVVSLETTGAGASWGRSTS